MELIQVLDNPYTREYTELKNYVLGGEIPWFYQETSGSVHDDKGKLKEVQLWGHSVMVRPNQFRKPYSTITSDSFESTCKVIMEILEHNNIRLSVIYRINFNLTLSNNKNKITPWHQDLEFPHTNLIVYLSDFSGGWTYVRNDEIEEKSIPKKDGIIIFDGGLDHCHAIPKNNERRIVLVVNYLEYPALDGYKPLLSR